MIKREKPKGIIQLIGISSTEVKENLSNWNARYGNYRSVHLPGVWECRVLKHSAEIIHFQFVDHAYEKSRGLKVTEAPILLVSVVPVMNEMENRAIIKYHLQQRIAVILSFLWFLCVETAMLFASLWAFQTKDISVGVFLLCVFVFLLSFTVCWLLRKLSHDHLTIVAFKEIISKNFNSNIIDTIA